jgi:plasmid stabilization system protein ParE
MPRGDKSSYTEKQERKADHITDHYEDKGVPAKEAERRAWATVNKDDGGGKKSGSGRGKSTGHPATHRGGEKGGKAEASRKRNAEHHAHP